MLTHIGFFDRTRRGNTMAFTRRSDGADWNELLMETVGYDEIGAPVSLPPHPWFTVVSGVVQHVEADPSMLMPIDRDVYTTDQPAAPGMLLNGSVLSWPVAPPPPARLPESFPLKRWEFMAMVRFLEVGPRVDAEIAKLPTAMARAIATERYRNSDIYEITDPLVAQLRPGTGMSETELRTAWMQMVDARPAPTA